MSETDDDRLVDLLPAARGRGLVVIVAVTQGMFRQIAYLARGSRPATRDELSEVVSILTSGLRSSGARVLFEPVVGEAVPGHPLPGRPLEGPGFTLWVSSAGQPLPGSTGRALEDIQKATESSVLELGAGIQAVVGLARDQVEALDEMARAYGASSGLGESLVAVEAQMRALSSRLADSLATQEAEVSGAATWVQDIMRLAQSVEQIAESARLLTFNAKVESARVGEAGRGFVVIASSMNDLAQSVRKSNDVVRSLARSLAQAMPRLEEATRSIALTARSELTTLGAQVSQLREALATARAGTERSLGRSEESARALRDRTNSLTETLQFEDRISQLLRRSSAEVAALAERLAIEDDGARPMEQVGELGLRHGQPPPSTLQAGDVQLF